jgi:uncharacterized membrane protein YedE/YeeE
LLHSLIGGVLIGLAAALVLLTHGRTAGISSLLAGSLPPVENGLGWRLFFLAGLVGTGVVFRLFDPGAFAPGAQAAPVPLLVASGLLVGFGTRLGGGCTSGHGVCGIGRLSRRSIVATLTFMATGALTVLVARRVWP